MKKFYPFIFALSICQIVSAQITLTSTTSVPITGDAYSMQTFNTVGGVRQTGANKTWNLSSVSVTSTVNYGYIPKSAASEASSFPQSNLVDTFNTIFQSFSVKSNSTWASEGTALPPLNRTVYTDKREWIDFPITYNNTFNETFAGTYTTFLPTSSVVNRGGTIQIKADAYGTLILPYTTVNNVLRVINVATYTETSGATTDNHIDTIYSWYNATTRTPLATYNLFYKNGALDFEGGGYLDQADIVLSVDNYMNESGISLYPNPASNQLFLNFDKTISLKDFSIQIIDIQGKVIADKKIVQNGQNYNINIANLSKGIYTLKINYNNKISIKKFIKE